MPTATAQKRVCHATASEEPPNRVSEPAFPPPRSTHLQEIEEALAAEANKSRQLPSPSDSPLPKSTRGKKRKELESSQVVEEQKPSKRTRVIQDTVTSPEDFEDQPVLYWTRTGHWPSGFGREGVSMSQDNLAKRKSVTTHHSDRLKQLARNGVHMRGSVMMQQSSKDLCNTLLEGSSVPTQCPCYPPEKIPEVLERIHELNEFRLQRDVTPWVVPSPENLVLCGDSTLDWIGEEVQADWSRCATIGSSRPRPDFAVGLQWTAFTQDEIDRLQNYATPEQPFYFTPNLCFPFLICEAKTGQQGVELADRQNIHSASIAVRAIIRLAEAAYGKGDTRVKELHGKVLVFTVSHNNRIANLYGHYAIANDDMEGGLEFFRYDIYVCQFSTLEGRDRYSAYNFVRNVYNNFAPEHLARIKAAALSLPALGARTKPAFAESESGQPDSQQESQGEDCRISAESSSLGRQIAVQQSIKLIQQLQEQLEQERKANKERDAKQMEQLEQLEQERKENKEREARQTEQLEQMMEMISRLQPHASG